MKKVFALLLALTVVFISGAIGASAETVYPEGTRICLDRMNDDPFPVESGTFGKVDHVDDIGTLHCIFDNGRTLGVIPGVDDFHVIREGSEQTEEEMNMSM